ncbi:M48 family metallopeptidase [Limnoraphis robusta Tam1]|uniref:M48 family metallopeptidase n=1 Tax=Limnoraphis robusta TaxID=1118279 RepID=UPI002B20C59D|nr:M48 family metallopeptidase [Limnoraphis robusta]MEA5501326.1 M48 family metallopeptidase [Limnoraphis robusta BA-68 BA1]MEA5539466.1 M48 family metallopeptidase [Limnoraphis robusta Tam1]
MSEPEFSSRNPPPSDRQLLILLAIFGGFIIATIAVLWFLFEQLVWFIPIQFEQQIGRLVVPVFEQQAKPSPTQTTLNQLVDRLETHLDSTLENRDYQVLYIPQPTINALAIPGDRIVIFQGLLGFVESENELMMILGHELGHFAHRDHLRGISRGLFFQTVLSIFLPNIGSLESLAVALSNAQFSQSQERQADEFGLTLLQENYGHVAGATDFFERLKAEEKGNNIAFLQTHPPSQERIKRLQQLTKKRGYQLQTPSPLPASLNLPN